MLFVRVKYETITTIITIILQNDIMCGKREIRETRIIYLLPRDLEVASKSRFTMRVK